MIPQTPSDQAVVRHGDQSAARHGWLQAVLAVLAGLVVMGVVAALGLWAAGAADLPDNAFPRVVAATVVTAVGGTIELSGDAGVIADTQAGLTVIPLSVTLAGALVIAAGFLRPLRHRAVAGAPNWPGGPPGSPSCGCSPSSDSRSSPARTSTSPSGTERSATSATCSVPRPRSASRPMCR